MRADKWYNIIEKHAHAKQLFERDTLGADLEARYNARYNADVQRSTHKDTERFLYHSFNYKHIFLISNISWKI